MNKPTAPAVPLTDEQIDRAVEAYATVAVPAWCSNKHRPGIAAAIRAASPVNAPADAITRALALLREYIKDHAVAPTRAHHFSILDAALARPAEPAGDAAREALTDEEIDAIVDAAHAEARFSGEWNGGMVGQRWNHIAARAVERYLAARGHE